MDRKDNKNETIIPTGGSKGDEAEKKENWHFKRDRKHRQGKKKNKRTNNKNNCNKINIEKIN